MGSLSGWKREVAKVVGSADQPLSVPPDTVARCTAGAPHRNQII